MPTSLSATKPFYARRGFVDAGLATLAVAFAIVGSTLDFGDAGSDLEASVFALAGIAGVALLARRQNPLLVLVVVVAGRLIMTWDSGNEVALAPAAMIALYTVTRAGDRRSSLTISIAAAVLMMLVVAGLSSEEFFEELAGEAALMLLPIAVGDAARSRADRIRDLVDTEAAARVQAERIRIARDLHDVVAHGLSTIAIQSGVAAHLLEGDPNQAKQALETINATGKRSLEELRAMVGVLRSTDHASLKPTPSDPNDLSDVLSGGADSGLTITTQVDGRFPPDVSDACVVAVHRIIQEALTNAARHAGTVPVDLSIRHGSENVRLKIVNQAGAATRNSVQSTGVGIIGMTERAESLGGTLRAVSMPDGGFEVDAAIPYHLSAWASEQT